MLSPLLNLGNLISSIGENILQKQMQEIGKARETVEDLDAQSKATQDLINKAKEKIAKDSRDKLDKLRKSLSPINSKKESFVGDSILKFPRNLGVSKTDQPMPFVRYKPYNYSATGDNTKDSRGAGAIYLPMTATVTQNTNPNWAQESDIISQFTSSDPTKTPDDSDFLGTAWAAVAGGATKGLSKIVTEVTGALGAPDITKATMRRFGSTFNPFNERFFDGVSFRVYSFEHKFLPNSLEESFAVFQIIRRFQYFSLPDYAFNKNFLTYPSLWRIGFFQPDSSRNKFLPILEDCVVTLVGVVFGGGGTWSELEAGEPVEVTLSLQVTETTIPTKSRMLNEESKGVRGGKINEVGPTRAVIDRGSL